jgi:hypothetical protein
MRIQRILLLTLFGFLAAAQPFAGQDIVAQSTDSVVKTLQAQYPPPPDCGIYDTCKG